MTSPPPFDGGRTEGRSASPETVGAIAAAVVVAILAVSLVSAGRPTQTGGQTPPPTIPSPSGGTASTVDLAMIELLIATNDKLLANGTTLTKELDRGTLRTTQVIAAIRGLNSDALFGLDAIDRLRDGEAIEDIRTRLRELYGALRETADQTLGISNTEPAGYRRGAAALVKQLEGLPAIQADLASLRDAPVVAVSAEPTTVPSEAPPASEPPPPASEPPPSTAPVGSGPLPSAVTDPAASQIVNGGFEVGIEPAWNLVVAADGRATVSSDPELPAGGLASARVDIAVTTPAFSGIALRQAGLAIEAGGRYRIRLAIRAEEARDIRVRVISSAGASYLTRVATGGPGWTIHDIDFPAPITDPNAVLEIGLGRSTATTWLDDVSFTNLAPNAP